MARTSTEIKASITTDFISRPEIIAKYDLIPGQTFEQQFSVASFESILFDTIANDIAGFLISTPIFMEPYVLKSN